MPVKEQLGRLCSPSEVEEKRRAEQPFIPAQQGPLGGGEHGGASLGP
jgi:hypothetical protein